MAGRGSLLGPRVRVMAIVLANALQSMQGVAPGPGAHSSLWGCCLEAWLSPFPHPSGWWF